LTRNFKLFCKDQAGSVTTDWVFLAAAIVTMSVAGAFSVFGGTIDLTSDLNTNIALISVGVPGG